MTDDLERAKPPDRDRAIAVVEAAYAAGRIIGHDRAFRLEQIRTAGTRGEVQAVVRDLPQPPPGPMPAAATVSRTSPPRRRGARPRLLVSMAVGALVLLSGLTLIGTTLAGQTQVKEAQPTTESAPAAPDRRDLLTRRGYADLVAAVEEKTGRRQAFQLVLYPDRATIAVPVDKRSRRQISYLWNGEWSDFGGKGTSATGRFSLDEVDGVLLHRVVVKARKQLGDATTWYVVVTPPTSSGARGSIRAIASNDFGESETVSVELGSRFGKP